MQGLNTLKLKLHTLAKKPSLLGALSRGSAFSFLLVFSLVFAQAVSLNHSHDGEVRDQVDCEICLKVGSSDDVLISDNAVAFAAAPSAYISSFKIAAFSIAAPTASARAPPHA